MSDANVLQGSLAALAVDWRFKYDKSPTAPRIYVGGESGVFRSTDMGATWTRFPSGATAGVAVDGGGLPVVHVVDLDLAIGNFQRATGLPLCAWPLRRPPDWSDRVNRALPRATVSALRECVQRGRPWGDAAWVQTTADRLGLGFTLRVPGRPKKNQ